MNIFGKKPPPNPPLPPHTLPNTQQQPARSYDTNKYSNPANPVRKTQKKLDISSDVNKFNLSKINDEYIFHEINPLNVIKDVVQTELVDGIQILKFNERVEKGELSKIMVDEDVRRHLQKNYSKILLSFLKNARNISVDSKSLCGEPIEFITGFNMMFQPGDQPKIIGLYFSNKDVPNAVRGTIGGNNDGSVFFDVDDFQKLRPKFFNPDMYISPEKYDETVFLITNIFNQLGNTRKFENLRNEFSKCKNPYYVIPIQYYHSYGNNAGSGGHQNLLLLDKLNEAAIYIEPQFYGNIERETSKKDLIRIHNTIDRILKELNIPEYKHVIPVTPYPQSIVGDTNCMFWTFLITVTYIINTKSISPDQIASAIIKKYPTKEELIDYIEGFKERLNFYIEGMKNIKGYSAFSGKRKSKRKTMRKRKRKFI